jgi:cation transport regulator ChaC
MCCGVCYRVGEADVESVLGNLDFREKGGYTRDVVEVTPVEVGRPAVRALLYTANRLLGLLSVLLLCGNRPIFSPP